MFSTHGGGWRGRGRGGLRWAGGRRVDTDVDTEGGGGGEEGGGEGEGRLETPNQGLSVISCSKYKDTADFTLL